MARSGHFMSFNFDRLLPYVRRKTSEGWFAYTKCPLGIRMYVYAVGVGINSGVPNCCYALMLRLYTSLDNCERKLFWEMGWTTGCVSILMKIGVCKYLSHCDISNIRVRYINFLNRFFQQIFLSFYTLFYIYVRSLESECERCAALSKRLFTD